MTRKHFKALAEALSSTRPDPNGPGVFQKQKAVEWVRTRDAIADVCAAFNSNFDRNRFNAATEAP